jgi:hypothetical protein
MPGRRFPAPWTVEELDAMTSHSKNGAIKPDQQDFDAVEKENGPLPPTASPAALAERYRLAQAAKVIRSFSIHFGSMRRCRRTTRFARSLRFEDRLNIGPK